MFDHLECDRDGEALELDAGGDGGDPCLWGMSRATAWMSAPEVVDGAAAAARYWRKSMALCCMAHEVWPSGSKSEDKS